MALNTVIQWGRKIPITWLFHNIPKPAYRIGAIFLALMMVVSLVMYGVTVFVENKIVCLGKETRALHEDNQDLQIKLDRLRSYQKVAEASQAIQGLQVATNVIDVIEKKVVVLRRTTAPLTHLPKETYGY